MPTPPPAPGETPVPSRLAHRRRLHALPEENPVRERIVASLAHSQFEPADPPQAVGAITQCDGATVARAPPGFGQCVPCLRGPLVGPRR